MNPISSVRLNSVETESYFQNTNSNKENHIKSEYKLDISEVFKIHKIFSETDVISQTKITHSKQLSDYFGANIYLKREDQQLGKTYKIRGGYQFYLTHKEKIDQGIEFVVASDGNFGSAIAILASKFKFKCRLFVPYSCFEHKIQFITSIANEYIDLITEGNDFQETQQIARKYAEENGLIFLQPHQSKELFVGYATLAKQIIDGKIPQIDYLMVPSGGGALVSSLGSFFKQTMPSTKIVAVEPDNCTPFSESIMNNKIVSAQRVSKLCNGSSVKKIGTYPFELGKTCVDGFVSISQNKIAESIIKLYSIGLVCEPSGGLGIAGLYKMKDRIKGKNIMCILTGSNMDLTRLEQLRELSMISKGYKNYYMIDFPNKKGCIYDIITKCFKRTDILSIQYTRKITKDTNQALIAVESPTQEDVEEYMQKMAEMKFSVENITERSDLLDLFF